MSQEIKDQVTEALAGAKIAFNATYQGLKKNTFGNKSDMDEWLCTFNGVDFEYFTGLGHRAKATETQKQSAACGFPGLTTKDKQGLTNYGRRYLAAVETLRKPQAPHPTDVLCSLILDSSAVGQSFASWCSDFGYDEDSRKAFASYTACQENADKLSTVFRSNRPALDKITELLQEY